MGKITGITKLKRLYKISLSGFAELEKIYVCEDTIVHFMLSKDKALTETELEELTSFDQLAQGKALALYFISFKARTGAEVRKYLLEHEIKPEQIEPIIGLLEKNQLINDQTYAENFIQGKLAMASAGPFQITQKLMNKGIERSIIDRTLEENFPEESQIDVAVKLAEKYARQKAHQLPLKQLKQKILQHLTSKGFNYSVAQVALEMLELEADEENESDLLYTEMDKAVRKYSRNYEGYDLKNRVTQALARKGFDFDDIRSALRDYEL